LALTYTKHFILCVTILVATLCIGSKDHDTRTQPIPKSQWTEEAKLWGARSCIGEAGFGSPATPEEALNECVSIMHVYATRYWDIRKTGRGWSLTKVIRKYSAAVKQHSTHTRPWILGLRLDGAKPEHWPKNIRWGKHKPLWTQKLEALDKWAVGELVTLTPDADHYGGSMDARHAEYVRRWSRVVTPEYYRNIFFNSKQLTGKRTLLRNKIVLGRHFMSTSSTD